MIKKKNVLIFAICFLFLSQGIFAQDTGKTANKPEAKLVESGPYQTSELASLHIDILRNAMQNHPNSKGIFIIYCGEKCQYGEVEAHIRGINISVRGKSWKTTDFSVLQGGFREKLTVEYWLVPENACLPMPNSTIDIKGVKFKGIFKGKFVPYDCCEY